MRVAVPWRVYELRARSLPLRGPRAWALSVVALVLALALGLVVLALTGVDPLGAYGAMLDATVLGGWPGIADTLTQATPLVLTGLGCALAFRAGLWNVGAEGQLLVGAWAATGVASVWVGPGHGRLVTLGLMTLAGFAAGALWGAVPGVLRAHARTNEILSSLMLTYVAVQWNNYWIYSPWSDRGFQMTPVFPRSAWMPTVADFLGGGSALRGSQLHLGLVFALVLVVGVWLLVSRTRLGYELGLLGANPDTAHYAGVPVARRIVQVLALSGGLAGLAGMLEVSGVVHRLQEHFSPGYGFSGILVAWLARLHPAGVVVAALLFAVLLVGAKQVQPSGVATMLQGVVLLALIACEVLYRYRVVRRDAAALPGGGPP